MTATLIVRKVPGVSVKRFRCNRNSLNYIIILALKLNVDELELKSDLKHRRFVTLTKRLTCSMKKYDVVANVNL